MNKNYTATIKKLDNSEVEITGEITSDFFESMRAGAVETLANSVKIDGFRQGHIPEKILVEKLGEMTVLEEMAERAIGELYPSIITDLDIDAIGRPSVSITKIAAKNPLGFMIKQAVMPEIKLPDYKEIAKSTNKQKESVPAVTEEELETILLELRKSRGTAEVEAPELTDEMVKGFGDFENVEAFKNRVRENLKLEKEYKEKDKHRSRLIDALLEKAKINLPEVIIERELDSIMAEMKSSIAQMGLKFEDYLTRTKKTEEELRKESREAAIKRANVALILKAIADDANVKISDEEMAAESDRLIGMYKDADPAAVRHYVEGVLRNEAVFKLLETE